MFNENKKNQEEQTITPKKELTYALEGINNDDYGEVTDCLNQFTSKLADAGLSAADREDLRPQLIEIEKTLAAKEIPESHKEQVTTMLERAKSAL